MDKEKNIVQNNVVKVSNENLKDYFAKTSAVFSANSSKEGTEEYNPIYVSVRNILKYELGTLDKNYRRIQV